VSELGLVGPAEWEHSIAEMDVTRWSITFRSLTQKEPVAE